MIIGASILLKLQEQLFDERNMDLLKHNIKDQVENTDKNQVVIKKPTPKRGYMDEVTSVLTGGNYYG